MNFGELPRGEWFEYEGVEYCKLDYPSKYGNALRRDIGKVILFNDNQTVKRIPQHYLLEMEEGDVFLGTEDGDDTVYTIVKNETSNED